MFVGLHALAAMQFRTPELAISEDEGKAFMKAAQNVARHYSVETTQKTLDWIAFIGTGAGIYGTRIAAIGMRRRGERGPRPDRPRPVRTAPAPQPGGPGGEVITFGPVIPTGADPDGEGGFAG